MVNNMAASTSRVTGDSLSEIAFFDVETTIPTRPAQGYALLEFGAILVCPKTLEELQSYSTLIRPSNPSLITSLSVRCNGITRDAVSTAPSFSDIADTVYGILHGRIWAGHNILRFDCPRIREAFAGIGRPAPEPKGTIDSLALLTQKFGRRAGDMKMASLATYFGLGKQTHRSLDDVRMNLEVVKYCATVLFLESSLPETFPENNWVSPNVTTRSRKTGKSLIDATDSNENTPSSSKSVEHGAKERNHPIFSLVTSTSAVENTDPFDMSVLRDEMNTGTLEKDDPMVEIPVTEASEMPPASAAAVPVASSNNVEILQLDRVSVPSIRASYIPYSRGGQKIALLHNDTQFELYCPCLKVRFGLSTKFMDYAGRPRLSFMVDLSPSLCSVLDACDELALKLFLDSGSHSNWRRVVVRHDKYTNYPKARVNIPTLVDGNVAQYATEMYQKERSGTLQKLVFCKFDPEELEPWLNPGTFLDAYLSLDTYDYQNCAGIRLVAKKLVIHNE
ncbi:Protein NEN2 [Linum perenne]